MRSSGQSIIRKIIMLFGLLIAALIVNAAHSTYLESRNISRRVAANLHNKLDIAVSIQNNELDQLGMISVSIKEQSGRFADYLDYDNIVPITMMLKNITNVFPDDIDFIFLFDEDGELITSNITGTGIEDPERYKSLIADRGERVGIEEISPEIFQGQLAECGDIFFIEPVDEGFMIIAVIDCTGHGVPGAFLTMIASSALSRIISDEKCRDPALILKRLNLIVKATLHQDTAYAVSDDGMDAALCIINIEKKILTFAGARLPLFCSRNGDIQVIKGDRQSIGYKQSKRSDIDFDFTNHQIQIEKGMSFYMATDGFEDQLGGERQSQFSLSRFGSRQFKELLKKISYLNFETREAGLLEAFEAHKGNNDRQDDVTVVGFSIL